MSPGAPGAAEPPASGRYARLHAGVESLSGWRRLGVAAGLGLVAAAALPPLYALPLLVPAFTGLMWLGGEGQRPRAAFGAGFAFGFAHFAAGLYWMAHAFLVEAETYAWMAPFAVGGLAAVLALFPALALALTRLSGVAGVGRVLVFAVLWVALEWTRGVILTGFPWNLIGSAWAVSDAMMQAAALAGVWGLSLLTVIVAAMPAAISGRGARRRRGIVAVLLAFAVLGGAWAGGWARLGLAGAPATVEGVRLRIVQPAIPQSLKWQQDLRLGHVARQLEMSLAPAAGAPPTHVVWAEMAVPFVIDDDADLRAALARAVPPGGLLIAGAPRAAADASGRRRVFNSLFAIDGAGAVVATYDKVHLVPFGEYLPWRGVLGALGLEALAVERGDFSPGPGRVTLEPPGLPPASPLICYEIIFPGRVVAGARRPAWLLNVTNDAWFGTSSGPYQHFAMARLRAVEEGLPVVRAANNGVSAVIDAYGRTTAALGLNGVGIIDADLPAALAGLTPYARFGDGLVAVVLVAVAAAGIGLSRRG